jgi:hypothetical protein
VLTLVLAAYMITCMRASRLAGSVQRSSASPDLSDNRETDLGEICAWLGTYRERLRAARAAELGHLEANVNLGARRSTAG